MNNTPFYNLIHQRGVTTTILCRQADCGRVHLSEVLNGKRSGRYTWPKLRGVLDDKEYECAFRYASAERVRLQEINASKIAPGRDGLFTVDEVVELINLSS